MAASAPPGGIVGASAPGPPEPHPPGLENITVRGTAPAIERATSGSYTTPLGGEPPVLRRRSGRRPLYGILALFTLIGVLVGAGTGFGWLSPPIVGAAPGICPTGITLLGEGASFIHPLMSQWTTSFAASTSNRINYNPAGAGAGITALTDRTIDFAATDEPLSSDQYGNLPAVLLTVPVTAGALAIVYNLPTVAQPLRLNGTALADIYLGSIADWNDPSIADLNPGMTLPADPIITVHRVDAAGTTAVLTQFLAEASPAWGAGPGQGIEISWPSTPGASTAVQGNALLASFVERNPYTIGYVDLTDVFNAPPPGLSFAAVQNPSGEFVRPNLADTASAIGDWANRTAFPPASGNWENVSMVNAPGPGDYPLATLSYLLVYQAVDTGYEPSLAKAQALVQWLRWATTVGQAGSAALDYVPIPPSLLALDADALATVTFDGRSVPECAAG